MARRRKDQRLDALGRAFAQAVPGKAGPGSRYPDELQQMAIEAFRNGVALADVVRVSGVSGATLTRWLKRRKDPSAKKRGRGKARRRRFQRLQMVDGQRPAQLVSMYIGRDVRLDVPVDLLTADFVRRLGEAPS